MMTAHRLWALALPLAATIACGDQVDDATNAVGAAKAMVEAAGKMQEMGKAADEASRAAEEEARAAVPEGASPEEAKQLVDTAKAMAAMQAMQRAGGGGPITNWRQLAPFLPDDLGGFSAAGKLKGSTSSAGAFKNTSVRRPYASGDVKADISIADTSLAPMMQAPFKMAAMINEDSTEGYKKGTRIAGSPAMVEWREESKRSKATVLAGDRYIVSVEIRNAPADDAARKLLEQLDLAALAKVEGEAQPASE